MDAVAVTEAVTAFYEAFEERDLDAMSDLWVHDDTVSCTHPGWATLHGWAEVGGSWFAIFDQAPPMQVFVTDLRVNVRGDVAWASLDENLLGVGGDIDPTTVAALKVLRRDDGEWLFVAHHGSVVAGRADR